MGYCWISNEGLIDGAGSHSFASTVGFAVRSFQVPVAPLVPTSFVAKLL